MTAFQRTMVFRIVREVAWAPVAVLVVHAIAGDVFGHEPYVDPAMHFLGGVAVAFFVRRCCRIAAGLIGEPPQIFVDLFAMSVTCTAAVFWEFAEFFVDQLFGSNMQRSVANTMRDLLLGTSGAAFFLIFVRVVELSGGARPAAAERLKDAHR